MSTQAMNPLLDISVDALSVADEMEEQKATRLKKNKQRQARRNCAIHRKDEMERYEADYKHLEEVLNLKLLANEVAQQ